MDEKDGAAVGCSRRSTLGDLETLPDDVLLNILSYFSPKELRYVFQVSTEMERLASHNRIWRQLFLQCDPSWKTQKQHCVEYGTEVSWKQKYKQLPDWKWDDSLLGKASEITVINNRYTVTRLEKAGRNPSVFATHPLTRLKSGFRVAITSVGKWVGVGVATKDLVLSNNSTLGTQAQCKMNSCYFWQNNGIHRIQMFGEKTPRKDVAEIKPKCKLDVQVDFDANLIFYFNDGVLQGAVSPINGVLEEGKIYPCANLSHQTEISFRNFEVMGKIRYEWRWGTKKAAAIQLKDNNQTAYRVALPKGSNPAVICNWPLTPQNNHFCVEVKAVGEWIGIGVCDNQLSVNNSRIVGTQEKGINSSYFFQRSGIHALHLRGGKSKEHVKPIIAGDILDVVVQFDKNKICYFNNGEFQGKLTSRKPLLPGVLYPCANLAIGSEVTLRNNDSPPDLQFCNENHNIISRLKKIFL